MLNMTNNPVNDVARMEKYVARLEEEYQRGLTTIDAKIAEAKKNPYAPNLVEELQYKRDGMVNYHDETMKRHNDALAVRRSQAAEFQAEQLKKQQAEIDRQEEASKRQARRAFIGTDAEFNATWPALWRQIREQKAVAAAQQPEPSLPRFEF